MIRFFSLALAVAMAMPASASADEEAGERRDDRSVCTGYALVLSQAGGETYDPAHPAPTGLVLRLRAAERNLPRSCAEIPVEIRPWQDEGLPLRLGGAQGFLRSTVAPESSVERQGDSLLLSANARRRLIEGDTVSVKVADLAPGQFVRPDVYDAVVRAQAGRREPVSMRVSSQVMAVLRFEATEDYAQRALDLGELSDGADRSLLFFYRTNSDVTLQATSENNGRLAQTRGAQTLPYSATFSGRPLNLSGGSVTLNLPYSSEGLQSRELRVVVPKPSELPFAGDYRDVIVLTFIPR